LSDPNMDKRKTHLRGFEFSESLVRSLEKEASDEGMTVNALANSIIGQHFNLDRKAKEFGFVSLHASVFVSLLEDMDDTTLAQIGRENLAATWKEMAEFWYQDSTPDRILEALSMRSRISSAKLRTRVTKEEGAYTVVCHHEFGPKWSIVLKSALQEFVRKSFLVEPSITAGTSVVTARFKVNPQSLPF